MRETQTPQGTGRRITGQIVSALLFTLLAFTASATESAEHHPMRFERLSLESGLSQSNILAIHQDSAGLMWFGTENGLNRYNGYEFEHFKRDRGNPDGLASDFIFDIAEDPSGNLWLATNGGGLAMLDKDSGKFTTYRHDESNEASIGSNVVRRVLVDDDGAVWAGTRGAGLSRLDPKTGEFTHFRFNQGDGAKPDNVFALYRESESVLWVGGDHGLSRLNTNSGVSVTYGRSDAEGSLSDHSVRAIHRGSDGQLWVGTYGGGLHRFDAETETFVRFTNVAGDDRQYRRQQCCRDLRGQREAPLDRNDGGPESVRSSL